MKTRIHCFTITPCGRIIVKSNITFSDLQLLNEKAQIEIDTHIVFEARLFIKIFKSSPEPELQRELT